MSPVFTVDAWAWVSCRMWRWTGSWWASVVHSTQFMNTWKESLSGDCVHWVGLCACLCWLIWEDSVHYWQRHPLAGCPEPCEWERRLVHKLESVYAFIFFFLPDCGCEVSSWVKLQLLWVCCCGKLQPWMMSWNNPFSVELHLVVLLYRSNGNETKW